MLRLSLRVRNWPTPVRWGAAVLLVLIAFAARIVLWGTSPHLPFITFLPAVVLITVYLGRGPAWAAVVGSAALALYYFVEPAESFALTEDGTLSLGLYALVAGLLVVTLASLQDAYTSIGQNQRELEGAVRVAEEQRRAAEARERDLDLLITEFGHRVKNDLARVGAMLRMQSAGASPETAAALRAAADRVLVLARIHDRLARCEGQVLVDVQTLLADLVQATHMTADMRPIGFFVSAEIYLLPASRAGAVGLLANELLTNALKHAFPGDRAGAVNLLFRREGDDLLLIVADDGIGMHEAGPDKRDGSVGIGRRLTRALAAQLGGRIETTPTGDAGGTTHTVRFPVTPTGSRVGI